MCYNFPEPKVTYRSENNSQNFRSKREEPYHNQNGPNKLHKCDKCLKTFDYHHSMIRHNKLDHPQYGPNSAPEDEKVEEKITKNTQLKVVYMNVNSLIAKK